MGSPESAPAEGMTVRETERLRRRRCGSWKGASLLAWAAEGPRARVRDGVDTFVIEEGWIVAETTHYTVETLA